MAHINTQNRLHWIFAKFWKTYLLIFPTFFIRDLVQPKRVDPSILVFFDWRRSNEECSWVKETNCLGFNFNIIRPVSEGVLEGKELESCIQSCLGFP